MSEISALAGVRFDGGAVVEEAGLQGMITIKADLGSANLTSALGALGLEMPAQRAIVTGDDHALAWMAPDELLLLCPHEAANSLVAQLSDALRADHAIVVSVSDARAMFRLSGAGAREALAKVAPVDLHPDSFGPGEMRRTRVAQVPAAFWQSGSEEFSLICFRSVAQYVFDVLVTSSQTSVDVGYF